MKPLWQFTIGLLVIHAIALVAILAWLGASDRLNGDRIRAVGDLFRHTVTEQAKLDAEAEAEAEQQLAEDRNSARLRSASMGKVSVTDRLAADRKADELSLQRVQWLARATENLTSRLERDKALIAEQKAKLDADREKLLSDVDKRGGEKLDEDFLLAVQMIEQLEPVAAKAVFQQLIDQGNDEQVIEYLVAMELRKAGAVLREFTTPDEMRQAKELIQKLRHRGIDAPKDSAVSLTGSA